MPLNFSQQSCYLISLLSREDRRLLFIENTNNKGREFKDEVQQR
jgi:hypothetical protein